jgi:hypothetical protein
MAETQLMLLPNLPEQPAPVETIAPSELVRYLRRFRMRVSSEAALQMSIEEALVGGGIPFEREVRLSAADRIDFMVGSIGIEAKCRYPKRSIFRQLERYAARAEITALILITGTAMGLPAEIGGKPVFIVSTGRASL